MPPRHASRSIRAALLLATVASAWAAVDRVRADTAGLPAAAGSIGLDQIRPGQSGTVWTVFQGTRPEPFTVEVSGIVRNALGPGRSIILCRLTDPRVQGMGAVAGMSGSPLYIAGRFAGALSYQVQRFETTRFAGFTPAADMLDVAARPDRGGTLPGMPAPDGPYRPLRPAFSIGGLSPQVARLLAPRLAALGIEAGGIAGGGTGAAPSGGASLGPGDAVSGALATGDVSVAGTGTVSRVDGRRVTAFGHPMLGIGDVDLPMCSAEIVAILPSNEESVKVANIGPVIGRITQDRLSAVSGDLGPGPAMVPVRVTVERVTGPARTLRFAVVRHALVTPAVVAAGVSEAVLGSNDAGLAEGFRLSGTLGFPGGRTLRSETLFAGPQAFAAGLSEFVQGLSADLQNPYERTFPDSVEFTVAPLPSNPTITIERFTLSRNRAGPGDTVVATLVWRDYQGSPHALETAIPVDASWTGRRLEIVAAPGRALDEMTGRGRIAQAAQLRSFDAFLDAQRDRRPPDGVFIAVVEHTTLFADQALVTTQMPGSYERIARTADEARYEVREALQPLWEARLLPGTLPGTVVHRPLDIVD